jgi:hypothetical protein
MGTDCSIPVVQLFFAKEMVAVDRVVCPHFSFNELAGWLAFPDALHRSVTGVLYPEL